MTCLCQIKHGIDNILHRRFAAEGEREILATKTNLDQENRLARRR
jgi:hypothetical protein